MNLPPLPPIEPLHRNLSSTRISKIQYAKDVADHNSKLKFRNEENARRGY